MQQTNQTDDYQFLWLGLILIVNLFVYSPSLFHIARPDQNAYLYESSEIKDVWDTISFGYNYTRSHLPSPEDKFLFRPIYYVILLIERGVVGYSFFIWQLISLSIHLWIVYQLFCILTFIFPSFWACLFALNFSVLHISQQLVINHQLTPLLLQTALLITAFRHWIILVTNDTIEYLPVIKIVIYLTIANLIHEFSLMADFVFIFILFAYLRMLTRIAHEKEGWYRIAGILGYLLLPLILFFAWSSVDYMERFGKFTIPLPVISHFSDYMKHLLALTATAFTTPLLPSYLNINFNPATANPLSADLSHIGYSLTKALDGGAASCLNLIVLAMIPLSFILMFLAKLEAIELKSSKNNDQLISYKWFISLTALFLSLGLMLGLVILILAPKGFDALNNNLYFFYPIILFFQIFIYKCFHGFWEEEASLKFLITASLIASFSFSVIANGYNNFKLNLAIKEDSDKLLKRIPENIDSFFLFQKYARRGLDYYVKKDYDHATEDFDKALTIFPKSVDIHQARGEIYGLQNKIDDALEEYNTALDIDPDSWRALASRGKFYVMKGATQSALNDFDHGLEINPHQADIYNERGKIYYDKKLYEQALDNYNQAIEENPNFTDGLFNRGMTHLMLSLYPYAIDDFSKAIELDPKHVQAHYNRAQAFILSKKFKGALVDYNALINIFPTNGMLYFQRAFVNKALNDNASYEEDIIKSQEFGYQPEDTSVKY